jgi:hypothetical protein
MVHEEMKAEKLLVIGPLHLMPTCPSDTSFRGSNQPIEMTEYYHY